MVCTICHESQFSAPAQAHGKNRRRKSSNTSHPVALQCGHVFHRPCIQGWFSSSERSQCPLCHKTQVGPLLILYVDEDTVEAHTNSKSSGEQTTRKYTAGPNIMDELYMQLLALDIEDGDMREIALYRDSMYYQQEIMHLEEANEELREDIRDMELIMESLVSELEEEKKLKEVAVNRERARANRLQAEVNRLTRVSEAHKRHVRSLQFHLEDKKSLLREQSLY